MKMNLTFIPKLTSTVTALPILTNIISIVTFFLIMKKLLYSEEIIPLMIMKGKRKKKFKKAMQILTLMKLPRIIFLLLKAKT